MKTSYIIIDKGINKYRAGKNKNEDIYLYAYIKLCSVFKIGISHATQEKLVEKTEIPLRTIQNCIKRLRESDLITVKTIHDGEKKHNTYYFDVNPENFFFVDTSFFHLVMDVKLKGFLLLLKSLCINNSNLTLYNRTKIAELLGQDRGTVSKMIEKLIEKDMLVEIKGGFVLPANYFPYYSKDTKTEHKYEHINSYDEFVLNSIIDVCREKRSIIFIPDLMPLKFIFAKYPLLEKDIHGVDDETLKKLYLPEILKDRCSTLPPKIESLNYFMSVLNVEYAKVKLSDELRL